MWNPEDYAKNSDAQLKWAQSLLKNINLFTKYVPEQKRDRFIVQFVDLYLANNPLDEQGLTHVSMVRLEVDACKT